MAELESYRFLRSNGNIFINSYFTVRKLEYMIFEIWIIYIMKLCPSLATQSLNKLKEFLCPIVT